MAMAHSSRVGKVLTESHGASPPMIQSTQPPSADAKTAVRGVPRATDRSRFRPLVVAYALDRALAMLRPSDDSHRQQPRVLRAEIAHLQAEARLADVIA
jgi:hypothetical protein